MLSWWMLLLVWDSTAHGKLGSTRMLDCWCIKVLTVLGLVPACCRDATWQLFGQRLTNNAVLGCRYQVQWDKRQQMWRQSFSVAGQKSPCWLRVHVFTQTASSGSAPVYGSNSSSGENDSSSNSSSSNTTSSTWDLPDDFVLYRTYTIRFIPLKSPEQLSLRSITFNNNVTTVIACGVPRALSHLFQTMQPPSLSSVMGMDDTSNSSSSSNSTDSSSDLNSLLAPGIAGHPRISGGLAAAATGSSSSSSTIDAVGKEAVATAAAWSVSKQPQPLVPAPGQVVQVAYLVTAKPQSMQDLKDAVASNIQKQRSSQATAAAAATGLDASDQPAQQLYSLYDPVSNRTVVWNRFTSVECAQDRYVLLPLTQMRPDMKMTPELVDPDAEGVDIQMTQSALALFSSKGAIGSAGGANSTGSTGSNDRSSSSSRNPESVLESSAKAGILGLNRLQYGQGLCGSSTSGTGAAASSALFTSRPASNSSSLGGGSSRGPCGIRLPGITAEVPIILTADEGRSSKTYTLLLYSNESAAAAVQNLVLPQEAAAAESAVSTAAAAGNSSSSDPTADAAQLSAAYFASRPKDWPPSPAQSDKCAVCPNGTYSTRVDAFDCKVGLGEHCAGTITHATPVSLMHPALLHSDANACTTSILVHRSSITQAGTCSLKHRSVMSLLCCCAGVPPWQVCCNPIQHLVSVLPPWQLQLLLGRTSLQEVPAWNISSTCRITVL